MATSPTASLSSALSDERLDRWLAALLATPGLTAIQNDAEARATLLGGALATLGLSRFGRGHVAYGRAGTLGVATVVAVGIASVIVAYWTTRGYA